MGIAPGGPGVYGGGSSPGMTGGGGVASKGGGSKGGPRSRMRERTKVVLILGFISTFIHMWLKINKTDGIEWDFMKGEPYFEKGKGAYISYIYKEKDYCTWLIDCVCMVES